MASAVDLPASLAAGPVILDGGLATELERRGHNLSGALWSARLLEEDPQAVLAAHLAYFAAGAQVATTASYQVSEQGFLAAGYGGDEWARMLRRSVELARRAQEAAAAAGYLAATRQAGRVHAARPTWVAASVGPYGAVLADGSEYHGDYGLSVAELRAFHRPRLEVLTAAGADVLACETLPCLAEVEAVCVELADLATPAWVSLTVTGRLNETAHGSRTRHGENLAEAYAMAGSIPNVIAVGMNCAEPGVALEVVQLAAEVSGKPVVVYPNSGETWDAGARTWAGSPGFAADAVTSWIGAGARLVGGCCRVGPCQIEEMAAAIAQSPPVRLAD